MLCDDILSDFKFGQSIHDMNSMLHVGMKDIMSYWRKGKLI